MRLIFAFIALFMVGCNHSSSSNNSSVAAAVYQVSYLGNSSGSGTVPVDGNSYTTGSTATVLDNTGALAKTNSAFNGWNTAADGSGTAYAAGATLAVSSNVTLYAQWICSPCLVYEITFTGGANLSGATGADARCMSSGTYPGTGTYKALLGSTGSNTDKRIACTSANCATSGAAEHTNWVLYANTQYTRLDGTPIGTTTAAGLFSFPLSNSISTAGTLDYTGLATTWLNTSDCLGWTVISGANGYSGSDTMTSIAAVSNGVGSCGSFPRGLYCVQQ